MQKEASSRDRHPGVGKGQEFIEGVKEITNKYTLRKRQEDNAFVVTHSKRTDMIYPDEEAAKRAYFDIDDAKEITKDIEDEEATEEAKKNRKNEQAKERREEVNDEEGDEPNYNNPAVDNTSNESVTVATSFNGHINRKAAFSKDSSVFIDSCEPAKVVSYNQDQDSYEVQSALFNDIFVVKSPRLSDTQNTNLPEPSNCCPNCHTRYWGPKGNTGTYNDGAGQQGVGDGAGAFMYRCPSCGSELGVQPNGLGTGEKGTYINTGTTGNTESDKLLSAFKKYMTTEEK